MNDFLKLEQLFNEKQNAFTDALVELLKIHADNKNKKISKWLCLEKDFNIENKKIKSPSDVNN